MEEMNRYGEKIKALRERSGISQSQLARYLDVDQSLISRIEKNERQPGLEMLDKMGALFGCSEKCMESDVEKIAVLQFAFRANEAGKEDMDAIASINRIVLNLHEMKSLLGGGGK